MVALSKPIFMTVWVLLAKDYGASSCFHIQVHRGRDKGQDCPSQMWTSCGQFISAMMDRWDSAAKPEGWTVVHWQLCFF